MLFIQGTVLSCETKIKYFFRKVQINLTIWQTLDKFYKTSQVAELQDIPQIESLIKEIFII